MPHVRAGSIISAAIREAHPIPCGNAGQRHRPQGQHNQQRTKAETHGRSNDMDWKARHKFALMLAMAAVIYANLANLAVIFNSHFAKRKPPATARTSAA